MYRSGGENASKMTHSVMLKIMTSNQLDFGAGFAGKEQFGLGFGITSPMAAARGVRSEGSFYWGGYLGTTYWVDPKEHLVVLIMTQHNPNSHSDLTSKIENLIYSALN